MAKLAKILGGISAGLFLVSTAGFSKEIPQNIEQYFKANRPVVETISDKSKFDKRDLEVLLEGEFEEEVLRRASRNYSEKNHCDYDSVYVSLEKRLSTERFNLSMLERKKFYIELSDGCSDISSFIGRLKERAIKHYEEIEEIEMGTSVKEKNRGYFVEMMNVVFSIDNANIIFDELKKMREYSINSYINQFMNSSPDICKFEKMKKMKEFYLNHCKEFIDSSKELLEMD